jgi:hypothetical protein
MSEQIMIKTYISALITDITVLVGLRMGLTLQNFRLKTLQIILNEKSMRAMTIFGNLR